MKNVIHKFFLLLSIVLCSLLCSCATSVTCTSMGKETYTWNSENIEVSIQNKQENALQKSVVIRKNGVFKKHYLPYGICSEEHVIRILRKDVPAVLPYFEVRVDEKAKPVMNQIRNNVILLKRESLDYYTDPNVKEKTNQPKSVTPADFELLQKPFWFSRGNVMYSFIVPMKPVRTGSGYQIPFMEIQPGGSPYLSPLFPRTEVTEWHGAGITTARVFCSILPFAFDVATFPVQLILLVML